MKRAKQLAGRAAGAAGIAKAAGAAGTAGDCNLWLLGGAISGLQLAGAPGLLETSWNHEELVICCLVFSLPLWVCEHGLATGGIGIVIIVID